MDESSRPSSLPSDEAINKLQSLHHDLQMKKQLRDELSNNNRLNHSRTMHNESKKSLKSDVKKSSMFVNKLRSINSEGLSQCIRDVDALNLTLYISEIVNAILEISFKPNDVPSVIKLAVALHKRYEDFSIPFIDKLKSSVLAVHGPTSNAPVNDDNQGQKRKRIQIRLLIELFEAGVFLDEDFFVILLKQLLGKTKAE